MRSRAAIVEADFIDGVLVELELIGERVAARVRYQRSDGSIWRVTVIDPPRTSWPGDQVRLVRDGPRWVLG